MSDVTPIRDPKTDWLITPQNAVLALIDYQPEQYVGVLRSCYMAPNGLDVSRWIPRPDEQSIRRRIC